MEQRQLYNILDSVDSTNNYAMGMLHEGLATHGMAWFAHSQTAGKGQRGKEWKSDPGKNLTLSIVIKPELVFRSRPFYFSAFIALCCHEVLEQQTKQPFKIKWPNDLFWCDRKAGGILIENSFAGTEWKWAVVGIGINVNQQVFTEVTSPAVSLSEITTETLQPVALGAILHNHILERYNQVNEENIKELLPRFNEVLYKKDQGVRLRKNFAVFETTIKGVNENGQLLTCDTQEREFNHGGVEWIL